MDSERHGYNRLRPYANHMVWHINDLCNMACSYCFFPTGVKDPAHVGMYSPQQISDSIDRTGRQWALFIGGGEPTLYPNFIELVNLIKRKHFIQISTNLVSRTITDFAEQVTPDNVININASSHMMYHTTKSLGRFLENYHLFKSKGFNITVSYVTHPSMLKRMRDDFDFLWSNGVEVVIPLSYQGMYENKLYPSAFTTEEVALIREFVHEPLELLVTMDRMQFKGNLCKAGTSYFLMDTKGDVYRCATISEPMGNMYEGTFVPKTDFERCPVNKCMDACFGIVSQVKEPEIPKIHRLKNVAFWESLKGMFVRD